MAKHCPICNRSSDEARFFGEFCEYCSRKMMLKSIKPALDITECKRCGRIRLGNGFVEKDAASIAELARKHFKNYSVKILGFSDSTAKAALGRSDGLSAETDVKIESTFTTCPRCGRIAAGYYEGVIQFRGKPERIEKSIERLSSYLDRNDSFITRIENTDTGKDVYVGSKTLAEGFLKRMHMDYKISYTLHGMKDGKKLYRNTYSVRI